jgi:hypothetical protein
MVRSQDRPRVAADAGMAKTRRSSRATVVFPDELGPESPMIMVVMLMRGFCLPLLLPPPAEDIAIIRQGRAGQGVRYAILCCCVW